MQSWEGLIEFVTVAETGSFTAAARRLESSVANVSRQVSALENRLGIRLFYRTTRKVTITEAGQTYYQHCRPLLDGLDEAERAVSSLQSNPRGKLRLTAPVAWGEEYVVPRINDFVLAHPEIEVEVLLTNQQVDLVEKGFDLAIRLGRLEDSTLIARRLATRTQYVCASPDYLLRYGTPHTLSELHNHNCLLGTLDYWRFEEEGRERNVRVKGRLRCNSGRALLDAAEKGLGLVQLPDYYVRPGIRSGALVAVLERYRPGKEGVWALYPQNRYPSSKVKLLIDYLSAEPLVAPC